MLGRRAGQRPARRRTHIILPQTSEVFETSEVWGHGLRTRHELGKRGFQLGHPVGRGGAGCSGHRHIGLLASGCSGWLIRKSTLLERAITIAAALGFVLPYHIGSVAGAALIGVVVMLQKTNWIKKPPSRQPKEVFRI